MINITILERHLIENISPKEFAEVLHGIMTDYVRMACLAGENADLKTVVCHIDFLEELRNVVLACATEED